MAIWSSARWRTLSIKRRVPNLELLRLFPVDKDGQRGGVVQHVIVDVSSSESVGGNPKIGLRFFIY